MTWQIQAQVNLYTYATGTSGTLDPMTGSTQLVAASSDDGISSVTPITFSFTFAGTNYTQFSANANGLLRLGATAITSGSTSYTNTAANAGSQNPAIMPYWDDLATGVGGKVHYVVTGSAPNRKLIVEWFVTVPRATAGTAAAKFQCSLAEGTNHDWIGYVVDGLQQCSGEYKHQLDVYLHDHKHRCDHGWKNLHVHTSSIFAVRNANSTRIC